jgi:hypothetical protein
MIIIQFSLEPCLVIRPCEPAKWPAEISAYMAIYSTFFPMHICNIFEIPIHEHNAPSNLKQNSKLKLK